MLCTNFFKRNLGFFNLAVLANLEYRLNFFLDVVMSPILGSGIEIILWLAIFNITGAPTFAGFAKSSYLSYSLWAAFFSRVTINWMYEFRMISEIESGSINGLIVRPLSFFEYYFSQFLGYKFVTTFFSFLVPVVISYIFGMEYRPERIFLAVVLSFYYLVLIYLMSFIVATSAFYLTRVGSITVAKNFTLMIFSGELFPLDIIPEPYKSTILKLPFVNGTFIPTAYLIGRVDYPQVVDGFKSITLSIIVMSLIAAFNWRRGLNAYVGTGA